MTSTSQGNDSSRLVAFVGSYAGEGSPGGIYSFDATSAGGWTPLSHAPEPSEAGYLAWSAAHQTLYVVDERKTDGRGPVAPAAAVHALGVDPRRGELTSRGSRAALGPYPTYLAVDQGRDLLISVSHGSFDHVERVVPDPTGGWQVEYIYDDSTVVVYDISQGALGDVTDVQVLTGHGLDPNSSPQAAGHGQASAHAHCAVIDPSGRHLVVCDKATDRIYVYALARQLTLVHTLQLEEETGPRHAAFSADGSRLFVTLEFSSELAAFSFDASKGTLRLLGRCASTDGTFGGPNEPAEVRVHATTGVVYVNNRGEDTLAWFAADETGGLTRLGDVPLARSLHPGLAARSFDFHPSAPLLALADRPADLVRLYDVDSSGALSPAGEIAVPSPAFVTFAQLEVTP